MSELALRITERKSQRGRYHFWRPVGSTIVCCSDSLIRRKWLEICCDLVSPKKRDKFKNIPGWEQLCEAWTPELREAWIEYDRPTQAHKLGRLLMDNSYPQTVWQDLIEPVGVLADIPFAPDSDVKTHDTWLWSEHERKTLFIVVNNDTDDEIVESWQSTEPRDAGSGLLLPELSPELFKIKPATGFYTLVDVDGELYWQEIYDPSTNVAFIWKKQIRYKTDMSLSAETLSDITNPEKVLHPRFDRPVESTKIIRPNISGLRTAEAIN